MDLKICLKSRSNGAVKNLLLMALLLVVGCDRSKSAHGAHVALSSVMSSKVGERDKDGNLLIACLDPRVPIWLKNDYGFLIVWPLNEGLETIYWGDRKIGEVFEFSEYSDFLARLRQCPTGSTVAGFTSCGGGWNHGMPSDLRTELYLRIKELGLNSPKNLEDETLCVCP
jgi:hypothetical protein